MPGASGATSVIVAGDSLSCAVRADSHLWCWGDDSYGARLTPRPFRHEAVGDLAGATLLARGPSLCGIDSRGAARCRYLHSGTWVTWTPPFAHAVREVVVGGPRVCALGAGALTCRSFTTSASEDPIDVVFDAEGSGIDAACSGAWLCASAGSAVRCWREAWRDPARELVFPTSPFEPARLVCRSTGADAVCTASPTGEVFCPSEASFEWRRVETLCGIDGMTLAGAGPLLCGLRDHRPACVSIDDVSSGEPSEDDDPSRRFELEEPPRPGAPD